MKTAEGTTLLFAGSSDDTTNSSFGVAVSIRIDVDAKYAENTRLVLTTATADSDGTLWQVTQTVTPDEMLKQIVLNGDSWKTMTFLNPNGVAVSDLAPPRARPVTPKFTIYCDDRDGGYQEVVEYLPGMVKKDRNYAVHLFKLQIKYFAIDAQLFEDVETVRADGTTYRQPGLIAILTPVVDGDSIVTMLPSGERRLDPPARMLKLGPLVTLHPRIDINWKSPNATAPQRAERERWVKAMMDVGMDSKQLDSVLRPHPNIRHSRQ